MNKYQLHILNHESDLSSFDCGNSELNDYLKNDALKNQNQWFSATRILYKNTIPIAFFTNTPDTLHKGRISLNDKIQDYPYQKFPAIKLARIGVDKQYQHQGIGTELMVSFFRLAKHYSDTFGGRFITVDAKNSALGFYEDFGFVPVASQIRNEIIPMYLDFYKYYNNC